VQQLVWALLIGMFTGTVTHYLSPSNDPEGGIGTTLGVGIVGAVTATSLAHRLFGTTNLTGSLAAGIGASLLCWFWAVWHE
jgi:uncharacterized membrane protein YeaQ/YmgE (transglycosylase-associated protein family)